MPRLERSFAASSRMPRRVAISLKLNPHTWCQTSGRRRSGGDAAQGGAQRPLVGVGLGLGAHGQRHVLDVVRSRAGGGRGRAAVHQPDVARDRDRPRQQRILGIVGVTRAVDLQKRLLHEIARRARHRGAGGAESRESAARASAYN